MTASKPHGLELIQISPAPHSRHLNNLEYDYQVGRVIVRNKNTTITSGILFLTIPYHFGRQTAIVLLFPARFLGEGNRPIKNLLTITITQGEHPPHLGEPRLAQRAPIPPLSALLQGQTQQILRCHGILKEHRQLRPILHQIIHGTATNQRSCTHQQHTPPRPRNKAAMNPSAHHATIQPHHTASQNQTGRRTESGSSHKSRNAPAWPVRTTPPSLPHRAGFARGSDSHYLGFAWVIPKAP